MTEIDSREQLLLPYIKGKTILDLGPGDTTYRSLHAFLCKHATTVVGVELDKKRVEALKKKGYTVVHGNAETVDVKKKFDVVIAGDLIEHVDNPGLFIDNAMKHLKPGGVFLFNTPNIHSINMLLRGLVVGVVPQFHEHTIGFTEDLLNELLRRRNLKPKKVVYFSHKNNRLGSWIIRTLSLLHKTWHENMFFVIQKKA